MTTTTSCRARSVVLGLLASARGVRLPGSQQALDQPWGIEPATGEPFTEREFTDRFIQDTGWPRFPLNDGAVPGTRIAFTSAKDFTAVYGNHVDRIGRPRGDYLGVPPGDAFDRRALPPDSLGLPLHEYVFSGTLPEGWTIEVSKVAPGFGRSGGGTQVRVLNGDGVAVPVRRSIEEGVLIR